MKLIIEIDFGKYKPCRTQLDELVTAMLVQADDVKKQDVDAYLVGLVTRTKMELRTNDGDGFIGVDNDGDEYDVEYEQIK